MPLEDEFNGIAWTQKIRSKSLPNLSTVELTFKPGTNLYDARQLVTERVAQGPTMVSVGSPPVMIQPHSSENRVVMIGLGSDKIPLINLSTLAYWEVRPRLLAVPGVAGVSIWGQRDQELQVLVDPKRMAAKNVSLEQILATTGDAMWTSPLTFVEASSPGADGFIDMPNQRISVQHILPIRNAADLAQIPIEETGAKPIRLGEVSTVVTDHLPLRGDAVLKSGPGFIMVVEKLPGANTLDVTRGVEEAMASLKPALGDVTVDTTVFRPATFIENALRNLALAGLLSLSLVVLWLGSSTRSWRVALIGGVAIVASFAVAAWVIVLMGATFNALTLAGLGMALGVVVGAAVLGIVPLKQRLAERGASDEATKMELITEVAAETARSLGLAVGIALLVVAPLLLVGGMNGALLQPVVMAYGVALLVASVVAIALTPVLGFVLLPASAPVQDAEPAAPRQPSWFSRALDEFTSKPVWSLVTAALLIVLIVAAAVAVKPGPLVPAMQDSSLMVQWQAERGTSLAELERITTKASEELRAVQGVTGVSSHIGQALQGDQIVDVDSGMTWISLDPQADRAKLLASVRDVLSRYEGVDHKLLTYPEVALSAGSSDTTAPLTVRLYGTSYPELRSQATSLATELASVQGLSNVAVSAETDQPALQIDASITAGAKVGLSPGAIRRQTSVLIAGIPVGSYYEQQRIFDVAVWSDPSLRSDVASIKQIMLATPSGGHVALGTVADVSMRPVASQIDHARASRFVDVTADVNGLSLAAAAQAAQKVAYSRTYPLSYYAEVIAAEDGSQTYLPLAAAAIAVILGMLLLLQAALGSWSRAGVIVLLVPLALSGGVAATALGAFPMNAGAIAGLVAVLGFMVLNSVSLARAIRFAEEAAGGSSREVVSAAATKGAGPILLASVAAALAVLPFIIFGDVAGLEVLRPMGIVVLGGLVTSTVVTLFLLPDLCVLLPKAAITPALPATEGGKA